MNDALFDHSPRLETARLDFSLAGVEDVGLLFEFNSSLEILRYVPRTPYTKIEQAEEKLAECTTGFENHTAIWWAITLRDTGEKIGYGGFFGIDAESDKAEIGYGLLPGYWKQGFASEGVAEIVRFGFENLELHRIFGLVDPENTASARILQKLGFVKEGTLKDDAFGRGRYFDMTVYARIRDSFR